MDPSRQIKLHYSLQYTSCDLADKTLECKPVLKLYLSSQFNRTYEGGGIHNIHLDEDHLEKTYTGTLSGTLKREHQAIPAMAAIGISSFAVHRNDYGHACYVNVGTSNASLGAILSDRAQDVEYDRDHDLMMRTVVISGMPPVKKGTIRLRITGIELGATLKHVPRLVTKSALNSAPMPKIENELTSYSNLTMANEARIPDIFPGIERVRAPYEISQIGIESTGSTFIPVIGFGMTEAPPASPEYFINAFERVMARKNLPLAAYHDFDGFEKARTFAEIVSFEVQLYDYIGDGIELSSRKRPYERPHHVGTEEFSIGNTMADDCESDASAIGVIIKGFKSVNFEAPPAMPAQAGIGRAYPSPARMGPLIEMQKIANNYVQLLVLSVVHGAKIGDEEGFGAHMYTRLMPMDDFKAGLSRTSEGRALLKRINPSQAPEVFSKVSRSAPPIDRPSFPHMFCEGTGKIDPVGYTDPIYDQRKYIGQNMPSVAPFKKEIPREYQGASPFYYVDMMAVSSEIIDRFGVNVGGFTFGTVNPNYNPRDPNNQHEMVRGALFTDVMAGSDKLAIMPQPICPESTMKIIKEAIALRPPFDPLVINKKAHDANFAAAAAPGGSSSKVHPLWEKLQASVRKFNRQGPDTKMHPSVDLFVRPHQFDEHVVNMMIGDAARLDRIYDVQYEYEPIRASQYAWRVRLFVK